jgi:sulfopyruvate decarboxylase subunit alpha
MMMQCSGLGNAANALGCFKPYGVGVPMVLSMRGTLGETNPVQVPMGRATKPGLDALDIQHFSITDAGSARPTRQAMLDLAYGTGAAAAVILEPELGGQRDERN